MAEPPKKEQPKKGEFMTRTAKDRLDLKKIRDTTENFDKKEAALKIIESRRQEHQDKEKPKTVVTPNNMPWVPNPHFLLPPNSISALSLDDHRRYVAIISNFTQLDRALRFEFNKIELEDMDAKLAPEREKFINFVKEHFEQKGCYSATFKGAVSFVAAKMKQRLVTLSENGYHSMMKELEWKKDTRLNGARNMYVRKPTILTQGKTAKLTMPDPSRRCVFEQNINELTERYSSDYSTKSIREDATAFDLAVEHDVTAVLTASTLKHLITAPFPLRQYRRAFPLSVFRKFVEGSPQRVVVICNPVPASPLAKPDLMRVFGKYIVRNSMEKREIPKQARVFKGVRPLKRPAPQETTENKVEEKKPKIIEEVSKPEETKPSSSNVDLLDSIFANMEASTPPVDSTPTTSAPYSYATIPVDNEGAHKVLVRFRPHGRDMVGNNISVTTKLQYIPQCGAEESFFEEKIMDALTAIVQNSTYQATVHLNVPDAHCLQLCQNKPAKIFDALPEEAKELFSGRWQRLYNLLDEIKTFDDGEYLLIENEDEMLEIWCEKENESYPEWNREKIEKESWLYKPDIIHNDPNVKFNTRFNGFAIHLPLTWHVVKGRIPASFLPPNPNKSYNQQRGGGGNRRGRGSRGQNRGRGHSRGGRGRGDNSGRKPVAYVDHDAIADE